MTTRRKFIKGAVSAAVAASIPGGDGVALNSIAHPYLSANEWQPMGYTYKTYSVDGSLAGMRNGASMARALAHSMMQTKEMVAANVFNRAFDPSLLEEIEIEIDDHSKPLSRTLLS